ncbi:flagellar hook-associated protein 2 [Terribacillus halophilus]|uniref:flagellar hook-associated protein 2 n=1 Tax=Terribacillus halophilus TaxID=361279 RepID=UPI0021186483|nr:flagellar hook-associated protein 2 [Terribacillus halophilus]
MVDSVSSSSNSMRVGGLASGIDTDSIVEKLMNAERQKLYKMQQDQTKLTWKQDALREVNTSLKSFDTAAFEMRKTTAYNVKSTASTSSAVTATASSTASNGSYSIQVEHLAKAAINISSGAVAAERTFDPDAPIGEQDFVVDGGTARVVADDLKFSFTTYDEDGTAVPHQFNDFKTTDSLNSILQKITDSDAGVRAFYDKQSDQVVLEKKDTGKFNKDGKEIEFSTDNNKFFTAFLKLDQVNEKGAQDATFTYNGQLTLTSHKNSYEVSGVSFQFAQETTQAVQVSVNNDVDAAFNKIKDFIDSYNEIVENVNTKLSEKVYRDYTPLTDEQKKEMSEDEIKLWEEKAKSGLLKGETALQSGMYSLRSAWYNKVDNEGKYSHLAELGITTSDNYLDDGKLVIDEDKLKAALRESPRDVYKLFSNNAEGEGRGIINRIEDTLQVTMDNITHRAGKADQTNQQFTLGRRLVEIQTRIDDFQDYLTQTEDRYWRQFSAMEQAISKMNSQSSYMMSNFGG